MLACSQLLGIEPGSTATTTIPSKGVQRYCARIALRVIAAQIAQMAKDAVNTGHMFASEETRHLGLQAGQLCLAPFAEP